MKSFKSKLVKFCAGKRHKSCAEYLSVPVWTLRNWLYGRNTPSRFTRTEIERRIK